MYNQQCNVKPKKVKFFIVLKEIKMNYERVPRLELHRQKIRHFFWPKFTSGMIIDLLKHLPKF